MNLIYILNVGFKCCLGGKSVSYPEACHRQWRTAWPPARTLLPLDTMLQKERRERWNQQTYTHTRNDSCCNTLKNKHLILIFSTNLHHIHIVQNKCYFLISINLKHTHREECLLRVAIWFPLLWKFEFCKFFIACINLI